MSTIYKEYRANCCRLILIYIFDDSVIKVQISPNPTKKHNNDIITNPNDANDEKYIGRKLNLSHFTHNLYRAKLVQALR